MNKFDRIYELHKILSSAHYPVPKRKLQEQLECSPATVDRTIEHSRLYLEAPIEYDREHNGYYYAKTEDFEALRYELPGLWFNTSELFALFTMHHLLENLEPGLFTEAIAPLKKRIENILAKQNLKYDQLTQRVRLIPIAARRHRPEYFSRVAAATLQRKQLKVVYHGRARNKPTERVLSPQRIVLYRDNWYLDAWCHLREALRSFSIDCIKQISTLKKKARSIPERRLDEHYARAYGIFAGKPTQTAKLRFSRKIALWVKDEKWHPDQQGQLNLDGTYLLEIPYGKAEELIMDILKYGPEVEVLEPKRLRDQVKDRLQKALDVYGRN